MKGLIDIHAHILPGVDDGASDFQESVRMLKSAYRQGVRCVIATPHYHRNHFHRNPERTMEALQKIRGWLREHLPDMIVLLGTEIYYTIDFAEEIAAGNIFPMAKSRYLLVEFSPLEDYAYIRNAVHVLINRGYCPIIAHAERYRVFHQNVSRVSEVIKNKDAVQIVNKYTDGLLEKMEEGDLAMMLNDKLADFLGMVMISMVPDAVELNEILTSLSDELEAL